MTSATPSFAGSVQSLHRDREMLDRLVQEQSLTSDFQPVVDLADSRVVGYKAIAHGPEGTAVATPVGLLETARATGHLERLDWMFRCHVFDLAMAAGVTKDLWLHITFESETYGSSCPPRLATTFGRARRELKVAVDVPVRAYDDPAGLARGLAETRDIGWLISLEDPCDHADAIADLAAISPSMVKVDLALAGRHAGDGQHPGLAALLDFAGRTGTPVVAESVDNEARRATAVRLGATYARGRVFGLAGELPS